MQVEKIIARRQSNLGVEYLVRWVGRSQDHDTWKPLKDLAFAKESISHFNRMQRQERINRKETMVPTSETPSVEQRGTDGNAQSERSDTSLEEDSEMYSALVAKKFASVSNTGGRGSIRGRVLGSKIQRMARSITDRPRRVLRQKIISTGPEENDQTEEAESKDGSESVSTSSSDGDALPGINVNIGTRSSSTASPPKLSPQELEIEPRGRVRRKIAPTLSPQTSPKSKKTDSPKSPVSANLARISPSTLARDKPPSSPVKGPKMIADANDSDTPMRRLVKKKVFRKSTLSKALVRRSSRIKDVAKVKGTAKSKPGPKNAQALTDMATGNKRGRKRLLVTDTVKQDQTKKRKVLVNGRPEVNMEQKKGMKANSTKTEVKKKTEPGMANTSWQPRVLLSDSRQSRSSCSSTGTGASSSSSGMLYSLPVEADKVKVKNLNSKVKKGALTTLKTGSNIGKSDKTGTHRGAGPGKMKSGLNKYDSSSSLSKGKAKTEGIQDKGNRVAKDKIKKSVSESNLQNSKAASAGVGSNVGMKGNKHNRSPQPRKRILLDLLRVKDDGKSSNATTPSTESDPEISFNKSPKRMLLKNSIRPKAMCVRPGKALLMIK